MLLKLEVDLFAIQGQLRVSFGEGSHLQSAATTKTRSDHAAGTHNEPEDNVEQNGGRMCFQGEPFGDGENAYA